MMSFQITGTTPALICQWIAPFLPVSFATEAIISLTG